MHLLPNEQEIQSSNGGKIVLTNFRVCLKENEGDENYSISIFLEKISAVETKYRTNNLYLGLSILCFFTGIGVIMIFSPVISGGWPFIVVGLFFFLMYRMSRIHMCEITSDGGQSLKFETRGLSQESLDSFFASC